MHIHVGQQAEEMFKEMTSNYPTVAGVIPQYSRVVKSAQEQGDFLPIGIKGTVLGAAYFENPPELTDPGLIAVAQKDPSKKHFGYIIQWDTVSAGKYAFCTGLKIEQEK